MKYAFAGNRDIAVKVLDFIISKGYKPDILMVTDESSDEIKKLIQLSDLPNSKIFVGSPKTNNVENYLQKLNLDYIFGIHYPYIITETLLTMPKVGFLNLHPAYLPYNRGWHTPSWSILDKTPAGATLHFMSKDLDLGDIIHQKKVNIDPNDTANSLYKKIKSLELEVFIEAFENILKKEFNLIPQNKNEGTSHKKKELFEASISKLDLNGMYNLEELMDKLRALTTNNVSEAAYFEKYGKKYRVQVNISKEE
jgi:methionyl-tRNA formyltransferase